MPVRYPFLNPDLPIEKRVNNLLFLMSVEEKVHCLGTVPDVPRLGVLGSGHVEGLHGLAFGKVGAWGEGAPVPSTQFPQAYGLGETWDPELVQRVGEAEGKEVRYLWESPKYRRGGLVVRAPNADLGRDPRWGRTEECFGEDPFLNGTLAASMTRGLQGDHPRYLRCASLLKHFLANSNEKDRKKTSSNFDERLFHEYYAEPFRRAIQEGGAQGVMAAYNAHNGTPCAVNPFLKKVIQQQWGHDGIICSDGWGMHALVTEIHRYPTLEEASADCVKAGIGQFLDDHKRAVRTALHKGLLSEAEVDASLKGVFRVMIRLGLLDPPRRVPYRKVGKKEPWLGSGHKALALEAAQKSIVLLKNDEGLLPLSDKSVRSVALIGPYADQVVADWYGGDASYLISPLEGLRRRLGRKARVRFAKDNQKGRAVRLARSSDVAVVLVGNHPLGNGGWAKRDSVLEGKEVFDREALTLRHEALVKKIVRANPKTVVVIQGSFPFTMNWTAKNASAILHMTHSGQETGRAMAQALFGDINPGGRLNQTWPKSLGQLPPMLDYDIRHGRTYMYFKGGPLYPFGHGLSYTTFDYSEMALSASKMKKNGKVIISFELANVGRRDGDEVAQLYVEFLDSKVKRPLRQLKAFQRVTLAAGKSKTVEMTLRARDLAYWDVKSRGWKVESGRVEIRVGASSQDLRLKSEVRVGR